MTFQRAAAFAPINIALVKYWGKRDPELNLPCASSLSVALAELGSLTVVAPSSELEANIMVVNDEPIDGAGLIKVGRVLRAIREMAGGTEVRAGIRGVNTVPTAQGLASSASAFAALATAGCEAYGVDADEITLSRLARTGSGSASRSVHGGWVMWHRGERDDGMDSYGEQLHDDEYWPLRAIVAHIDIGRKKVSSTEGMQLSARTSPYFDAWIETCERDVRDCRWAIAQRDFQTLATIVENNCLAMHSCMMATRPPLLYWQPATLAVIHAVRQLRSEGVECMFTIDAGPSVVVLAPVSAIERVGREIGRLQGVSRVTQTRIGGGAHLVPNG